MNFNCKCNQLDELRSNNEFGKVQNLLYQLQTAWLNYKPLGWCWTFRIQLHQFPPRLRHVSPGNSSSATAVHHSVSVHQESSHPGSLSVAHQGTSRGDHHMGLLQTFRASQGKTGALVILNIVQCWFLVMRRKEEKRWENGGKVKRGCKQKSEKGHSRAKRKDLFSLRPFERRDERM